MMEQFTYPNEWMHLAQMSNDKMLALYHAGVLTEAGIEFLHDLRIKGHRLVSARQRDWLEEMDMRVMQYDATHPPDLTDDAIADMIVALGGADPRRTPTLRAYSFKRHGDGT